MGSKSQCQLMLDQLLSHYPAETREKWEKFTEDQLGNLLLYFFKICQIVAINGKTLPN
jgi:hypothetical protein